MLVGVGVASVGQPRVPLVGVLLLLTIALVQLVVLIGSGAEEGETAFGAVEGANVVVALLVVVEMALGYELLGALAALEGSLVLVGSDVHLQIPLLGEALLADRAFEGPPQDSPIQPPRRQAVQVPNLRKGLQPEKPTKHSHPQTQRSQAFQMLYLLEELHREGEFKGAHPIPQE